MLEIRKHISSFFLLWFTVVSISICTAVFLASPLGEFLYKHNGRGSAASNDGDIEGFLSLLFLVGLFMGFGQWIVINTKIKRAHGWILATLIGLGIGVIVSLKALVSIPILFPIVENYYRVYGWVASIGTLLGAGMFTGLFQWISLKRKLAASLRWSLVNGIGALTGLLPRLLVSGYPVDHPIAWSISIIASAGLFALISGYFAELLIIHPDVENPARYDPNS